MVDKTQRVLVLGGGFAGAFAAKSLRRVLQDSVDVELVSERNYFVFQPLLPEVAAGTINTLDAVTPLRTMLKGIKVRMGEVSSVDFHSKTVEILQGSKRVPITREYDQLVLALGQRTSLERFEGFSEHSLSMRDLADAHGLRNHMLACLEHADVTTNRALKKRLLTFVVAGGGFSGVEIVGELQEMLERTIHLYPNIDAADLHTILVQRGQRILPELPEKLGQYAARKLAKRGVDIQFGTSLSRATASAVFTQDGRRIDTQCLITTVGNGPTRLVEELGIPLERGRIVTDNFLQVHGHEDVWALGDAALVPLSQDSDNSEFAPTTAQFALRETKVLARNIKARLRSGSGEQKLKPFCFRPLGTMASIGHYNAVAEIFGIRISGLFAWFLWRGFYISLLPGFSTKLRVALNWWFDYFLPRSIVQIDTQSVPGTRVVHYAQGDVLFEPGQIVDGLYAVVSGTLESRVPNETGGEAFVRILGAGDHWGERALTDGFKTKGWLTAVDDCELIIIRGEDFAKLRRGLPVLEEYLSNIPEKIYPRALRHSDTSHK